MLPAGTIEAFGLVLVRTSVLVLAGPLFGISATFWGARIGLVGVLTFVIYSAVGTPLAATVGPIEWAVMAAREALIGLALAFVMQGVILAVRVAGELIGQEMGFNMASVLDPETGVNTPVIAQIYENLFLVGLLALDGHHLMIRALVDSFTKAPIGASIDTRSVSLVVETLLREMFNAGIVFAMPVMVLMVLSSLLLALLARAVPQINMMDVGYTLRILVGLVAMYAFAPLVAPAIEGLYRSMAAGLDRVLIAVGG